MGDQRKALMEKRKERDGRSGKEVRPRRGGAKGVVEKKEEGRKGAGKEAGEVGGCARGG